MPNATEVEAERTFIVREVVQIMRDAGAEINHETIAAGIEAVYHGFAYDAALDDYARADDVTGEMAAKETADATPMISIKNDIMTDGDRLRESILDLDRKRGELIGKLFKIGQERTEARGILAEAIADFSREFSPPIKPQALARAHIAAGIAERAAQAKPDDSTSFIDRAAAGNAKSSDVERFTRKRFVNGGSRRGGFDPSRRGSRVAVRP